MDKKSRKHSKSLEEISNLPPPQEDLSRNQVIRHSLQTTVTKVDESPFRHTRSHNYGKSKKPTVILNDRIEEEEDTSTEPEKITKRSDTRGSHSSKKSHRSRSGSGTSKTRKESNTFDNRAYEGNLDSISVISGRSVTDVRRSNRSTTSSTRGSSISLEVQREQYCCQTQWTPCEKRLTALVVVLVTTIILLLVAVAALATKTE